MSNKEVDDQVTDGVTQGNMMVLGSGPALALAQTELALAQSQSVLFANMVSGQQQQSLANGAAITRGVVEMFENNDTNSKGPSNEVIENLVAIIKDNNDGIEF